jgi:hypothetical protein
VLFDKLGRNPEANSGSVAAEVGDVVMQTAETKALADAAKEVNFQAGE